jgi:2-polyprenyl-6-methoxyphenol hydroxylase-like FAD-dependent oxidoreductase
MRVLIVGAGIAGMSLAAMLRLRGIESLLIERARPEEDAGYVIGLWPIGTRVLHGLNLYEEFVREALPMRTYRLCNGAGELIKEFSLERIAAEFGYIGLLERQLLIRLLQSRVSPGSIRWGVTVETLAQSRDEVYVTLTDGTSHSCDLVVGSDGIHSRVRDLIEGPSPHWNTNWGLWGWWVDSAVAPERAATEYWAGGRFLGIYPALRRASVFAGAPLARLHRGEARGRSTRIHDLFAPLWRRIPQIFDALPDDNQPLYFWDLHDTRATQWTTDRVVLLGDSAAAFLPTAGIGASMALESSAVLADELSRSDARSVPLALQMFVQRRRARVLAAQEDSRRLAKLMFVKSAALAALRNQAMRLYSIDMFAKNIAHSMAQPA